METTACRRLSHGERNIKLRNQRRFCRGKVFLRTQSGIWCKHFDLCSVRAFFVECGFFSFVASRPLASTGCSKDCGLRVWKSGKDARKLTIDNKFHVKHSDGWRSFT